MAVDREFYVYRFGRPRPGRTDGRAAGGRPGGRPERTGGRADGRASGRTGGRADVRMAGRTRGRPDGPTGASIFSDFERRYNDFHPF